MCEASVCVASVCKASDVCKMCTCVLQSDKYFVQRKYSELQKEKKKGFGTGDFRRRDEFANVIRTEQYRQQLGVSPSPNLLFECRPSETRASHVKRKQTM